MSFSCIHALINSFLCPFIHSIVRSFVPSFLPSFLRSFVRSRLLSLVRTKLRTTFAHFIYVPFFESDFNYHRNKTHMHSESGRKNPRHQAAWHVLHWSLDDHVNVTRCHRIHLCWRNSSGAWLCNSDVNFPKAFWHPRNKHLKTIWYTSCLELLLFTNPKALRLQNVPRAWDELLGHSEPYLLKSRKYPMVSLGKQQVHRSGTVLKCIKFWVANGFIWWLTYVKRNSKHPKIAETT